MFKTILCPVDFTDATRFALDPAVSLVTDLGAELVLLHVLEEPHFGFRRALGAEDLDSYVEAVENRALSELDELLDDDASTRSIVRHGSPAREITEACADEGAELVVMPTHARTGVAHALWGSVTEKVVRLAPCPVMTVSPRIEQPAPFTPDRILLATDFSECAAQAYPVAVFLADYYDAELLLTHAIDGWDANPAMPEWSQTRIPDEQRGPVEASVLASLEEEYELVTSAGVQGSKLVVRGFDPAHELVRAANEKDADLIVMATHGRSGVSHLFLGSTTERVVRHAACPVLTVKGEGAE